MAKKTLKLFFILVLTIVTILSFSICFADETEGTPTTDVENTTEDINTSENPSDKEIHNGDLYITDTKVVMDKLVDGNVYIMGEEVEITGQVNGNLFILAKKITFNSCYVRYSVFACAESIYYNGACNDLYATAKNIEMTYDSYVVRDAKIASSDVIFKAAIGRDVDLACNKVTFGENEDTAIIYGNLRYSSDSEATIPEGLVTEKGSITFDKETSNSKANSPAQSIGHIIKGLLTAVVTVIVLYLLIDKFLPKFAENIKNKKLSAIKLVKYFITGLVVALAILFLFSLLLLTLVGIKLAFILALTFITLCLVSVPVLVMVITNTLKNTFKFKKTYMFYLALALISMVLYAIKLIPYAGVLLSIVISLTALGMLLRIIVPEKKLTDEEKAILEEQKQKAKELIKEKKQERLETKRLKKQEKEEKK